LCTRSSGSASTPAIPDGAGVHPALARPLYHRTRDSIEAHLTIVSAALVVSRWIEHQTGWPI
jgi:hypothetical protein